MATRVADEFASINAHLKVLESKGKTPAPEPMVPMTHLGCPTCRGRGIIEKPMKMGAAVKANCPTCQGLGVIKG